MTWCVSSTRTRPEMIPDAEGVALMSTTYVARPMIVPPSNSGKHWMYMVRSVAPLFLKCGKGGFIPVGCLNGSIGFILHDKVPFPAINQSHVRVFEYPFLEYLRNSVVAVVE